MKTFIKYIIYSSLIIFSVSQSAYSSEKIKIGLIVPLSGENSIIGEKIIKSMRMAISKINDDKIEIIPKESN